MISAVKALIDADVKLDGDIVLLGEVGKKTWKSVNAFCN